MKRCVSEKRLLALFEGRGTIPERAHVKGCESCTVRLQQLSAELALLVQVLREPPPPLPQAVPVQQSFRFGWVPVAVVGIVIALFLWSKEWRLPVPVWTSLTPGSSVQVHEKEIAEFLTKEVVPALFATQEFGNRRLPAHATTLAYLAAALDGGWPQERCEQKRVQGCESDPFALLFEEQEG
jgi:hypothetical protein